MSYSDCIARYPDFKEKKIVISGASGLIGQELISLLSFGGHNAFRLVRNQPRNEQEIFWDPNKNQINPSALEGVDAVINLSGSNVAAGRWSKQVKEEIYQSRISSTTCLVEAMSKLNDKPKTFISASAIGIYGSGGDLVLSESSIAGQGFLAEVANAWEAEAMKANEIGVRTVLLRTGIVLSSKGGALKKMLLPFKLGLGGTLGDGQQYMSWISLHDMVCGIYHLLSSASCSGPYNLVAPNPVTNREFTKTLGAVLNRPTIFPVPKIILKSLLGEMADELLLSSARVEPKRLIEVGFQFKFPVLKDALSSILN